MIKDKFELVFLKNTYLQGKYEEVFAHALSSLSSKELETLFTLANLIKEREDYDAFLKAFSKVYIKYREGTVNERSKSSRKIFKRKR